MKQLTFKQQQILQFYNKAIREWYLGKDRLKKLRKLRFACMILKDTHLFTPEEKEKYNHWKDIVSLKHRTNLKEK